MGESPRVGSPPSKPVLIFDGDCGFCRHWIVRWRRRTGDTVDYRPFQDPEVGRHFPEVSRARCARAVQLVEPDGSVSEGAQAVFRTLALAGSRFPLWLYGHIPGAASAFERAYRLVADHRPFLSRATTILWGRSVAAPTYAVAGWLFRRLLGIVYFIAFVSLGNVV